MNLHNDLMKVKVVHDCSDCCRKNCRYKSCGSDSPACENFYPENSSEFMGYVLDELRKNITPSKEKKLKRHAVPDGKSYNDKVTTLDEYYVLLVNSVLSEVRKGGTDYAYSLEQISDIMRFEPNISVKYIADAGAYEVRKRR